MATQNIQKFSSLASIRNWPTAAGVGFFNGQFWGNFNGSVQPIGGSPFFGGIKLVDGDNGSDTDTRLPYKTIQAAVTAASAGDRIYIKALASDSAGIAAGTASDPPGYAETVIIPPGKESLALIGVGNGTSQGAQPQMRIGTGSTAMLTVRSFGVGVFNLGFNGASSTGGGISLDSDSSTKDAGGLIVSGCHFKNCKNSGAATTGGAIQLLNGGSWYVTIANNDFFDCRGGIVVVDTSVSVPKDWKILSNRFYSSVNTNVDIDIYGKGLGGGVNGIIVDGNIFGTVDAPAYAGAGNTQRYLDLTGCKGILSNNVFACLAGPTGETELTFKSDGTAAFIPATVRMAANYGEAATATGAEGLIGR